MGGDIGYQWRQIGYAARMNLSGGYRRRRGVNVTSRNSLARYCCTVQYIADLSLVCCGCNISVTIITEVSLKLHPQYVPAKSSRSSDELSAHLLSKGMNVFSRDIKSFQEELLAKAISIANHVQRNGLPRTWLARCIVGVGNFETSCTGAVDYYNTDMIVSKFEP